MPETETGRNDDLGDNTAANATVQSPDPLIQQADDSLAEFSSDYYVTLQPLTLDLIEVQLQRIGIKFSRRSDEIQASWQSYVLSVWIMSADILSVRATFRQLYPAASITALIGRCNWWNTSRAFLKASTGTVIGQTKPADEDGESRPVAVAQLRLDLDLPLPVGVAPAQLQSLFLQIVGNVEQFEGQAHLKDLMLEPTGW